MSQHETEINDAMSEQNQGFTQVLEALSAMNSVNEAVREEATGMRLEAQVIVQKISVTTRQINGMITDNSHAISKDNSHVERFSV